MGAMSQDVEALGTSMGGGMHNIPCHEDTLQAGSFMTRNVTVPAALQPGGPAGLAAPMSECPFMRH
jgi:hypothetical protein